MAKQHSTRPWTQLASLRPASPPIPSPRAQSSQSPSQNVPTPSNSLSNSPSLKASHAPKISTIDNNNNNNNAYYANATIQPQNHKNITNPSPSPSHLKIEVGSEPNTLLIQKESCENKKQFIVHDEKKVTDKEDNTKEKGNNNIHKKMSSNSEDSVSGTRAITLAGENRGAHMEIIQSLKKPDFQFHHKKGNSKIKVYEYESEGNENGKKNKNHHKERTILYSPPFGAHINSNVQSSNNSLLYSTSCTSNDPGVQITLSRKPYSESEGFHLKNNVKAKENN